MSERPFERGAAPLNALRPQDAAYPESLGALPDPPDPLWAAGDVALLEAPTVAIVGTRRATPYGERITRALSRALARAGACVVSGLARGIDAEAHRAALSVGGRTAAVLGTGVDVTYPVAHRGLQDDIATRGLLLSEQRPGSRGHAGAFPRRNRIIAALARLTIVVEADVKSGALITAGVALELDRLLAAVPGPIDQPQSRGANQLLRDGAHVIASVEDALTLLGLPTARDAGCVGGVGDAPPDERAVHAALHDGPLDAEALVALTGLPVRRCLAALSALEVGGIVESTLFGEFRRR